jgi:chromosomal replication initiation ATPase DnaA
LLILQENIKDINKSEEKDMNEQFKTLTEIVCRHYNADPNFVLSRNHKHTSTTPRNIIATLWSRGIYPQAPGQQPLGQS